MKLKVVIHYATETVGSTKFYKFDVDMFPLTLEQALWKYNQRDFTWVNSNLPDRNRKVNMTEIRTENF